MEIAEGADKIYLEKLKQAKAEFELESQKEKADLQAQIEKVRAQSVFRPTPDGLPQNEEIR